MTEGSPDVSALVRRIAKLESQLAEVPRFRWGVVADDDPLSVQLELDPAPLAGKPATIVAGLQADDRVLALQQHLRTTIVGRGGGVPFPEPDPVLPAPQMVVLNAGASITAAAGTWQNVPSVATISLTLEQAAIVQVMFGAQPAASSGYSMLGVRTSGAFVSDEHHYLGNAATGTTDFGQHTPFAITTAAISITGFKLVALPAGTTVFTMRSRRSATGTHMTDYPTMTVTPLRWTV